MSWVYDETTDVTEPTNDWKTQGKMESEAMTKISQWTDQLAWEKDKMDKRDGQRHPTHNIMITIISILRRRGTKKQTDCQKREEQSNRWTED